MQSVAGFLVSGWILAILNLNFGGTGVGLVESVNGSHAVSGILCRQWRYDMLQQAAISPLITVGTGVFLAEIGAAIFEI